MFYNPTNGNATKMFSFISLFFSNWRLPEDTTSKNPQNSMYYYYYCLFSETCGWLTHELCFTGTIHLPMESFSLPVLYVDLKDKSIPVAQETWGAEFHADISKNSKL